MRENMKRNRVNGFLNVDGRKIVNELGEEIILTGWGLGNWLLQEGYMWKALGSKRFDRPRRIEAVIEELTGKEYADSFWKTYRQNYVTEADIRYMAELGYNSVRIPINARLFLEEGEGIHWVDEGFELLDRCIDWCEAYGLYVFLDLHGAPGGQTGDNIDDSIDDVPRLFTDQDCFDKGIALWKKLAQRYCDRYIIAGYDLLNEPIRPKRFADDTDFDHLLPRLKEFYETAIYEIRKIDKKHLISLEGHHWASAKNIFCKKYDDKMIIHFHRYACLPDISCYQEFLTLAEEWDCPLWLGETGENYIEWFTAMYPLAAELGIGYNIWPWKKMDCTNSPCSIKRPENWEAIINYAEGAAHPGYDVARGILDEFLEKIKLKNCDKLTQVSNAVLRQPGCVIRGTDFDHFPGKGISYSGLREETNLIRYRYRTGMEIVEQYKDLPKTFGFDCGFKRYVLELAKDEFAVYSLEDVVDTSTICIHYICEESSILEVYQDERLLTTYNLEGDSTLQISDSISLAKPNYEFDNTKIKLRVASGVVKMDSIHTN
ncbi:glycoside hydrolase family 5 protein [Anaerosporobacter sp.]|uniref:glycoside hydrolase family 5 protein n=1 Tax=Anaerosporobacter sp. TaxID=1872529 RepID=UPI00286F95E8|nr:cellulase family glycosylhydrolase [Anaerosporobacter sp.]